VPRIWLIGYGAAVKRFERYVAVGDSSTEGLDDRDGDSFRGWADRLAEHVAATSPDLLYANLAVRGRSAAEIRATQLAPAVAMRPDLATVVAGMNDLLRSQWDAKRVAAEVGEMVSALRGVGAEVITFTIPDVSRRMRLGSLLTAKTDALNVEIRDIARSTGARLLDLASYDLAHDSRMWAPDRIHGNPEGHARIAAALAHLLELPGSTAGSLTEQLPKDPRSRRAKIVEDVTWVARFVAPWALRRARGRTTGDGRSAKRPVLAPVRRRHH
jgi:lysophospholipase L1-like esterase